MNGLMVFRTLAEALSAGYEVFDRTAWGYIVRIRTDRGYALALVDLRSCSPDALSAIHEARAGSR
jgi:hypothetical protein